MQETQAVIAAMEAAAPRLHNGTYTVSHPQYGHFTLKIHTSQNGQLAGKRIISLLTGPDNVNNYHGIAFWDDERAEAFIWNRYKHPDTKLALNGMTWDPKRWTAQQQKLAIFLDLTLRVDDEGTPKGFFSKRGYEVQLSSHCCRCNRKLTTPESIRNGIGPQCAMKGAN